MGVAGLWEVLRPAGEVRSLTELAVEDGFNANQTHRGFRIGIDASIWFFHAAYGREGENPELRTLFFRCCRLLQSPLLPLFVFDGPNRPAVKRGKRVGGNQHWLTQGMKNIIDAFGFEWWVAPGEAEAELAYLNQVGVIDAVLSDDVDNFLFGAVMVIRNPSNTLSGNRAHPVKNAQGKDDGNHVVTYTADAIGSDPSVALSRSGTILIGLLSGGDYIPAGLPGCGQKFATGLARAGFGDSLVTAVAKLKGSKLDAFLDEWRQDIRHELKTNKSGLLPSKKPSLAASLPDDFPSLPVLMSYADPLTSKNRPTRSKSKTPVGVWRNDPDPMRIAALCELYFEWGVKDVIVQRFRTVLWPGVVCRAVRRAIMDKDDRGYPKLAGACQGNTDSREEDDDNVTISSSPTKQISSTLSTLALSSPSKSKKSSTPASDSTTSTSESFSLCSIVSLTSTSASSLSPLLLEVLSQRTHVSTDSTLEYRVLVDPAALVERAESGVKGLRPPLVGGLVGIDTEEEDEGDDAVDQDADESGSDDAVERLETAAAAAAKSGPKKKRKARREVPTTPLRLWLPACMVHAAAPALVKTYVEKKKARDEKKAKRGTKGKRGGGIGSKAGVSTSRTKAKDGADDGGDESASGSSALKATASSDRKTNTGKIGSGGGRRRAKKASEAQDEAYELIDLSGGESPCSESGEGVRISAKGKGKTRQVDATKSRAKPMKRIVTDKTATASVTVKEFYKMTKPSTAKVAKSKSIHTSKHNLKSLYEEEEESTDAATAPPLPSSSRPLDLLRAKSKSSTVVPDPVKAKPTVLPRRREEALSSSSAPARASKSNPSVPKLPFQLNAPVPRARKKPLFVDVSDADSDIEVSDIQRLLSGATATTAASDAVGKQSNLSDGVGIPLQPCTTKNLKVVDGVIDLAVKRAAVRSNSTRAMSIPANTVVPVRPASTLSLVTSKNTDSGPGDNSGDRPSTPTSRSPSKLAHILIPGSFIESEDEKRIEEDELPVFHRESRTKKPNGPVARPAPRPFPMQFGAGSPTSPCTPVLGDQRAGWGRRERGGGRGTDDDSLEIVDVFTTSQGPLPPQSPTPSPSPVRCLSAQTSVKRAASTFTTSGHGFPASPTKVEPWTSQTDGAERHGKTKEEQRRKQRQRQDVSSDSDACPSETEGNGVLKSPRKSAAHSSPRHDRARGRVSTSPVPWTSSSHPETTTTSPADDGALCTRYSTAGDRIGRKPRASDLSAIYISSESEDEVDVRLGVDDKVSGGGVKQHPDEGRSQDWDSTCSDMGGWADRAVILSAPPSPAARALSQPADDGTVASNPSVGAVPPGIPVRQSKFKPANVSAPAHTPSTMYNGCAPSTHGVPVNTSKGLTDARLEDTVMPLPVSGGRSRAPLLVARARQSKSGSDSDVIDLTSD